MNQVQKTQEIINKAESSGEVLKHLCELTAMLVDIFTEDDFELEAPTAKRKAANRKADRVPVQAIVDIYNESVTHMPKVRIVPEKVKQHIRRDWKEHKQLQDLDKWKKLFLMCDANLFLSGRLNLQREWKANLAWIVNPNNLAKIVNGNYKEHDTNPGNR